MPPPKSEMRTIKSRLLTAIVTLISGSADIASASAAASAGAARGARGFVVVVVVVFA